MSAPWVQTVSGRAWDLLDPHPLDVCWEDIAHSLARIFRFNGHTLRRREVSVAMHSLNVAAHLAQAGASAHTQLHGLLHDAHEAFIGDITTPVMDAFEIRHPGTRHAVDMIKKETDAAIFQAAGMGRFQATEEIPQIKDADMAVLRAERKACMAKSYRPWPEAIGKGDVAKLAWSETDTPSETAFLFMDTLATLIAAVAAENGRAVA